MIWIFMVFNDEILTLEDGDCFRAAAVEWSTTSLGYAFYFLADFPEIFFYLSHHFHSSCRLSGGI